VLGLRWAEVDLGRRTAHLADTKTGASMRPLADAACTMLRAMPQGGEMVFRAVGGDVPMAGFARIWTRVAQRTAGLTKDVTPHVLRHSYASLAADLGLADATIGALLGHRGHSVTRRYIHSADTALLAAADKVADEVVRLMSVIEQPDNIIRESVTLEAVSA
jgi:integrase